MWFEIHAVRAGRAYSDATGALSQRGCSGALYQIVFCHKDSNVIHIETTKSCSESDLLGALQRAVKFFTGLTRCIGIVVSASIGAVAASGRKLGGVGG